MAAHRRHDISDRVWLLLSPHLSGGVGCVGRPSMDNRLFINAVFGFCEQVRRGVIFLIFGNSEVEVELNDVVDISEVEKNFNEE